MLKFPIHFYSIVWGTVYKVKNVAAINAAKIRDTVTKHYFKKVLKIVTGLRDLS